MIPKNQKTATSTNQQARITSKHELTSVQSSCIPTNQHHEPRTRIPASTYQGHGYQQAPSSNHLPRTRIPASTYQGHGYQQAPSSNHLPRTRTNQQSARTSRHVSPASTNSPAFKVAAYLPTSSQHQPARTSRHVLPAGYEPTNDKKNITY